ncbi:MAG: hypothetical protein ACI87X_000414 [Candidatus Arcticimaribacter sp.]|jgi:hypothetical protein
MFIKLGKQFNYIKLILTLIFMENAQKFIKIFTGNAISVLSLRNALEEQNIVAVVKDDSESARLAGFGMVAPGLQEMFVHEDELDQAIKIIESLK